MAPNKETKKQQVHLTLATAVVVMIALVGSVWTVHTWYADIQKHIEEAKRGGYKWWNAEQYDAELRGVLRAVHPELDWSLDKFKWKTPREIILEAKSVGDPQ